jgi:membrane protein
MNKWLDHAKRISLPGLRKVPIYDVAVLYVNGISNGSIGVRAGGISFSFFLSLFPSIIFLFTLIPFVPIPNFQEELMRLIQEVLPSNTYKVVESTILDIATKRRLSLLSFGFLAALFFSTNGISAMIASFNASANAFENRSWLSMQFIALVLVVILFGLTTVATGLIIFGKGILNFFVANGSMQSGFSQSLFLSGQWFVILLFMLLSLSFLYYYAPAKRSNHHFFSPGSILATIVITLITLGFSYYLGHFGTYNLLYGSIGTLLALLIWLNMSSFVLLMGFELNVSIRNAQLGLKKKLELSDNSKDYERYYPKREELIKDT